MDIQRDIDVELVAKLAGVDLQDFRALNPSLHKPVIFAAGTPQILLPWDNAKVFRRNLQAYDQGQYASWTVWTAPRTLSVGDAPCSLRSTAISQAELPKPTTSTLWPLKSAPLR